MSQSPDSPPAATQYSGELTRVVLMVLVICLLLAGTFFTMLPFLGPLIWATTIVVATWPILLWFERKLGGRRSFAVVIMTAIILLLFIAPLTLAVTTLVDAAREGPALVQNFLARGLGPAPSWFAKIPLVGKPLTEHWQQLSTVSPEALVELAKPYVRDVAGWAVSVTGGVGMLLIQILIIAILIAILYSQGEAAARGVLSFGYRMGRERGEQTIRLAGQAVRSVALGVIVTALVQSVLAGIGLWACGVPHAGVLTAIAFVLGIAQLGPFPVLIPSIIWLYASGEAGWGTALLIWSLPIGVLDNVLRPILIRRGVQLPMLLIIAGVIGGLMSFGVLGLFVGPVILAATYTLTQAWIAEVPKQTTTD